MRTILLSTTIWLASVLAAPVFAQSDPATDFHRIIDDHWVWFLEQSPETNSYLGDWTTGGHWDDELLGAGAIPLDALEKRMDAWIARSIGNKS